jgi:hypothetical protein
MVLVFEHPGCYGLPVAISATSPSCRVCESRSACCLQAFSLLESLPRNPLTSRERLALVVKQTALTSLPPPREGGTVRPIAVANARGVSRVVLSQVALDDIALLPVRVGSQVRKLTATGWFAFARLELKTGRNPSAKGWRQVFCGLLLNGPFSRADLEIAFVDRLGLSAESARVQASFSIAIFFAGRIAREQFGRISLTPN